MARHALHGKCIFLPSCSLLRNVDKSLKGFQTIRRDDLSLSLSLIYVYVRVYRSKNDRKYKRSNYAEWMCRSRFERKDWSTIVYSKRGNVFARRTHLFAYDTSRRTLFQLIPSLRRRFTRLALVTRISIYRLSIPILTNNISNSNSSLNSSNSIKRNNKLSLNMTRCTATKHR